jgi:type II restriction enzyme
LLDLASSLGDKEYNFFLVAPDLREKEIIAQLKRPSFQSLPSIRLRYLLFTDLKEYYNGICKFGEDYRILLKVAKECAC